MAENTSVRGRIEQWSFPGDGCLHGEVYGDTRGRFADGGLIRTSSVVTPESDLAEGAVAETINSRYLLGKKKDFSGGL